MSFRALYYDKFEMAGAWCWVSKGSLSIVYIVISWFITLLNVIFIILLIRLLRNELPDEPQLVNRYIRRLIWFPVVQMFSLIPFTINVILIGNHSKDFYWLSVFQIITDCITGLAFAFVYGMNPGVYDTAKRCLFKSLYTIFCCNKNNDGANIYERRSISTGVVALSNTRSRDQTSQSRSRTVSDYDDF